MPEPTYLNLTAEDGRALRHKYLQQEGEPEGLVVLLPGDNYGVDGPLLYYIGTAAWSMGWDTAALTYGYQSAGVPFSPAIFAEGFSECQRAIELLVAERAYQKLVLVGKSLGAGFAALLCQQMSLPPWTRAVYLTPPLGPMFTPIVQDTKNAALLAMGTSDRYFDREALAALEAEPHLSLVTIPEADHSMNVQDDLQASLTAIKAVVEEVQAFITREGDEILTG